MLTLSAWSLSLALASTPTPAQAPAPSNPAAVVAEGPAPARFHPPRLELPLAGLVEASPPPQLWPRSQARSQTLVSGVVLGIGGLMTGLPWAIHEANCAPAPDQCDGGGILVVFAVSVIGGHVVLGSAIGLGIWAYRLRHRSFDDTAGLKLGRSRARLQVGGSGVQLRF